MNRNKCFWCKIGYLCISGIITAILFVWSLRLDYQLLLAHEHVRFRSGFPSQSNWITSPYGRLNSYLFNVTNAEAFLNGTDSKIKFEEIGPISYRITGRNEILDQTDSSLTYRKLRYYETEFDPETSCSPDILNQTIISPNFLLLGAASKLHDWVFIVRHAFNAITINEPVFMNRTVHYLLWDFTSPALNLLSSYVPNIVSNCGMLYNALRYKEEKYNVKIGMENGMENFFRVNSLNDKIHFTEHNERFKNMRNKTLNSNCQIIVKDAFDNSLFKPFITKDDELNIVAGEACRTLKLVYKNSAKHLGINGYRFVVSNKTEESNCLDNAMGIKLYKNMFDVSKCLFNDVPSVFSYPHFYDSSYNWSEHFEGLHPNEENHETSIIIEPITGIPIEEKYRFQSNIIMPQMAGYNKDLQRFSNMVVPTFWYEYDLDDLPFIVVMLMKFNIFLVPVLQPVLMGIFLLITVYNFLKVYLILNNRTFKDFMNKFLYKNKTNSALETTFENTVISEKVVTDK